MPQIVARQSLRLLAVCAFLLVPAVVLSALPASGQQMDNQPRIFVETGAPDAIVDKGILPLKSAFTQSFADLCIGTVITENRSRANYFIRLSASGGGGDELTVSMAVFLTNGDQVFTDNVLTRQGQSVQGTGNPLIRFMHEACALVQYRMDKWTVVSIASQARLHEPRIYSKMTTDQKTDQKDGALFGTLFSQRCFCVTPTRHPDDSDYVFEYDESNKTAGVTIFDSSGQKIFSRSTLKPSQPALASSSAAKDMFVGWVRDGCRAILGRESQQ